MTEASKRKTVRVAAAVLLKDGRVFATQRGYGPYRDWWELPGGKIEKGETPEEALRREIHEELDTEIRVGELFEEVEYDYPDFHLSMKCFLADVISGHLVLREHEDARWLPPERLDDVQWLPADLSVVDRLKRRLLQTE